VKCERLVIPATPDLERKGEERQGTAVWSGLWTSRFQRDQQKINK
jgi:hypothetical protein